MDHQTHFFPEVRSLKANEKTRWNEILEDITFSRPTRSDKKKRDIWQELSIKLSKNTLNSLLRKFAGWVACFPQINRVGFSTNTCLNADLFLFPKEIPNHSVHTQGRIKVKIFTNKWASRDAGVNVLGTLQKSQDRYFKSKRDFLNHGPCIAQVNLHVVILPNFKFMTNSFWPRLSLCNLAAKKVSSKHCSNWDTKCQNTNW